MIKMFLFLFTALWLNLSAQTFTKNLGVADVNDGVTSIAKSENGFYIGGYSNNMSYLAALDLEGNMLWKDEYDFTEQLDLITYITYADNKILGCGYGYADGTATFLEFYFKYDIETKSFDWIKRSAMNLKPATIQVLPSGRYLLTGDEYGVGSFRFFLMELDPNNGKQTLYSSYVFSGRESASTALVYENFIYTGGRYGLEAKIDKYRGAISKFDQNFNEVWSNYYLNYKDKYLRNYLLKLIVDDAHLISLFYTNNKGVDNYYNACLAKQTQDGDMIWAAEYNLEGYKNISVKDVKATKDAYYIYGFTKSPTDDLFLIKTDKEGVALWAKTYGGRFSDNIALDQGNFFEIKNDYLYLIAQSLNLNDEGNFDGLLMKINADGNINGECWGKEVNVNTTQYEDLIQGEIFLNRKDSAFRAYNLGFNKEKYTENLALDFVCFPKLATNDYDTILNAESIEIDFLKNDITNTNEKLSHKIISTPYFGTAKLENDKIIYSRANAEICALDSFKYVLESENTVADTAIIYVYTQINKNISSKLKDQVLPQQAKLVLDASNDLASTKYLWNTGETTEKISVTKPGTYTVKTVHKQCIYMQTVAVLENPYSFDNVATANITFLVDASSSMNRENRLPILKTSLYKIMSFMRQEDKLSMVKFSSDAEIIFNGIDATEIKQVKAKIDSINSEGRSNLKQGFKLSYETQTNNFAIAGNNRIIFTTDGDIPNAERLELIEYLKKSFPENANLSIFLFNDASIFKTQMKEMADAVGGNVYVITPENVEEILLKEFKAVRKNSN